MSTPLVHVPIAQRDAFCSWVERAGGYLAAARILGTSPGRIRHLRTSRAPSLALAVTIERKTGGAIRCTGWVR